MALLAPANTGLVGQHKETKQQHKPESDSKDSLMLSPHLQQLTDLGLHLLARMLAEDTGTVCGIAPVAGVIAPQLSKKHWQHLGHILGQVRPQCAAQFC